MTSASESGGGEQSTTIGKGSKISIGLVVVLFGLAGAAHTHWSKRIEALEVSQQRRMDEVEHAAETRADKADLALRGRLTEIQAAIALLADEVQDQGQQVDRRLERIEERSGDRWSWTDMSIWVERLRQRNPALEIPDPEPIRFPRNPRKPK